MDLVLRFNPATLEVDVVRDASGLRWEMDETLGTAVLLSLFLDRRAEPDDVLPDDAGDFAGSGDRRGWWANPDYGSRLWLLSRAKLVPETLSRARFYARESLQWILDEGIAQEVPCESFVPKPGFLGLDVAAIQPPAPPERWAFVWRV